MPSYLVETYTPVSREADVKAGFARMPADGGIRSLRATYVPEDETCFHVVEAPSLDVLRSALTLAAVPYERIVEAIESSTPEQANGAAMSHSKAGEPPRPKTSGATEERRT